MVNTIYVWHREIETETEREREGKNVQIKKKSMRILTVKWMTFARNTHTLTPCSRLCLFVCVEYSTTFFSSAVLFKRLFATFSPPHSKRKALLRSIWHLAYYMVQISTPLYTVREQQREKRVSEGNKGMLACVCVRHTYTYTSVHNTNKQHLNTKETSIE